MRTLRQLGLLTALAETLNLSRAGEKCHVTQSTLSTGLKELEQNIGVQLAERTRQSVIMTPIGTDMAEGARDILSRVKDIEDLARQESQGGPASLRMGAIPTVGPFILSRALPLIRTEFPGMKIFLRDN